MIWGCISPYGTGNLLIWEGGITAERYIKVLDQHMLPSIHDIPEISITRVQVLGWPACSPDLSPADNTEYNKVDPGLLSS